MESGFTSSYSYKKKADLASLLGSQKHIKNRVPITHLSIKNERFSELRVPTSDEFTLALGEVW